jgi:hypothetical protein
MVIQILEFVPLKNYRSIPQDDIRFTTVSQDWNEYVDDNGARIRIQPIVIRVAKTRFNARGEPHYSVEVQGTFQIRQPTPST